jgi:hypothetical protein
MSATTLVLLAGCGSFDPRHQIADDVCRVAIHLAPLALV